MPSEILSTPYMKLAVVALVIFSIRGTLLLIGSLFIKKSKAHEVIPEAAFINFAKNGLVMAFCLFWPEVAFTVEPVLSVFIATPVFVLGICMLIFVMFEAVHDLVGLIALLIYLVIHGRAKTKEIIMEYPMKTHLLFLLLVLTLPSIQPAMAGGGPGVGGATEITQIANNVQLAESYAQQVVQTQQQLLQYQAMLKNLENHAAGNISPELGAIAVGIGRVASIGHNIGNTMARVDSSFASTFQSPQAADFSTRFKGWSTNSQNSIRSMMLNAGMHRENFQSDEDALQALVKKNQESEGNLAAVKTLGEINSHQLQESMKLRELITQQQLAEGQYLAAQNAKEQAVQDINDGVAKSIPAPSLDMPANGKYKF